MLLGLNAMLMHRAAASFTRFIFALTSLDPTSSNVRFYQKGDVPPMLSSLPSRI
jgi:hypothetical protein